MEFQKSNTASPTPTSSEEFSAIAKSSNFQNLLSTKKKFIVPFTIFFLCFYFALPILTSYTTILHQPFIGSITWAWLFAFLQFVMTWTLCIIYSKKAVKFDELSEIILKERGR